MPAQLAPEHDPNGWIVGLLDLIASMAADGRRGVTFDQNSTFTVESPDDNGGTVIVSLSVKYDF